MRPLGPLIERDAELIAIDEAIEAGCAGNGSVRLVEGPAGIGKTSLLEEAGRRATARGATVLAAQGAALERDFGFGAVRQLFEPLVDRMAPQEKDALFAGAAALAAPVVSPRAEIAEPSQQAPVLHGLYWLTSNLADRSPLVVLVDDVQWCDPPSLQFLVYLARRLEGLRAAIVVAVRTGDPAADATLVGELRGTPAAGVVSPAPLTTDGVRTLIAERLGEPDDSFVEACRAASGGVPFLVEELVRALAADGVRPTGDAAGRIAETGPPTVALATMLRLSRLSPSAGAVARGVAVLGRQARLDRVALLAGIAIDDTRAAVEALVEMAILASAPELAFVHGLVRQAVYDDLPAKARADAHGRAADILAAERAPVDEVAAHLMSSDPEGRADVVEALRAAAGDALPRGAPDSAVAYLRRALAEGRSEERAALLHELGVAEDFARDPRAAEDLEEASRLAEDPVTRARIGRSLAQVYMQGAAWVKALTVMDDALATLGDRDQDLEARIEAWRAASEGSDPARAAELDARVPHLRSLVDRGGPDTRPLALILAVNCAFRDYDRSDAMALIEHGLDGGRLLREEGSEALVQGVTALVGLDDLDAADRAAAGTFEDAGRRGSVLGYISGCFYRIFIDGQRGRLSSAEAFLRSLVESSIENGVLFALPSGVWAGTDALLERPGLGDFVGLLDTFAFEEEFLATISGAWVMAARGRLRILHGNQVEGIADLRAAGDVFKGARADNPIGAGWRSPLALALPEEEGDEARALVDDELRAARTFELARSEGVALRAAGLLEGDARGIELLEESLRVLTKTEAPLEQARTQVELGAAMRRANHRVAAREPLRAGLELAYTCGAERLVGRAMDELEASGARSLRPVTRGPDALTTAEARVARMAADGMTNREIAQALFVSAKTVENQLSVVYRKLDVRSRDDLRLALATDSSR